MVRTGQMRTITASVQEAARCAVRAGADEQDINPIYRALLRSGDEHRGRTSPSGSEAELLAAHVTSGAVLVAALTRGDETRRLRLGLGPRRVTVERSHGEREPVWSATETSQVPGLLGELLEGTGPLAAAPRLTVGRESEGMWLTPAQAERARTRITDGVPAAETFSHMDDVDPRLRDALTADGDRVALSFTLDAPSRQAAESPLTWSRMWVVGDLGIYRMGAPAAGGAAVHPVADGDVLGTALPIVEQGVRFAAARQAEAGAR